MKKIISLIIVLIAISFISGCSLYGNNQTSTPRVNPTPTQPAVSQNNTNTINIENFSFNPSTITIKKGAVITWTNNDSVPHKIKSATFNSEALNNGQSFSFTFNDAGTFKYSCAIHPSMTGEIIVE